MERTFIAKNPSVLWFLLGLSVFTLLVSIFSEAAGSASDFNIFPQNSGQDAVPMPCCHRYGRGLGVLRYP